MGVESMGSEPSNKTYFIEPPDSSSIDYLEFEYYSSLLKEQLSKLGYIETQTNPNIKIFLIYSLEERLLLGTSTDSYSFQNNSSYINGQINKSSHASGSAITSASGSAITSGDYAFGNATSSTHVNASGTSNSKLKFTNKTYSFGSSTTSTSQEYGIPLFVSIAAVNSANNKPIWTISMEYILSHSMQMPNIMPWIFVCARWFIGHPWAGIINVDTKYFEDENIYYPFSSHEWRLQHKYFNNADVYLTSAPFNRSNKNLISTTMSVPNDTLAHNNIIISDKYTIIENPFIKNVISENTYIKSITLTDDYTSVEINYSNTQKNNYYLINENNDIPYINIDKNTYIEIEGIQYRITNTEGIEIAPGKTYISDTEDSVTFTLFFPPIPKSAASMHLIESTYSDFRFYGIQLR